MKYVNALNFEELEKKACNAKYLDGFVVHSKSFDGLKRGLPNGFLIWKTSQNAETKTPITEITVMY